MSSSKYMSDNSDNVKSWMPPNVSGNQDIPFGHTSPLTAEQLELLQKEAFEEGFAQGKAEGFEFGHKEGLEQTRSQAQALTQQFDAIMQTLESPLKILDGQVEQSLVDLAISIVRQLVRREIKTDPGQIIGVVREALSILPISSRNVRVILHPEDAITVRNVYEMSDNEMGWEIVEDPVLARGGCRVITQTSQIDATLESRLAALIAPLLGDEREKESDSDLPSGGD